MADDSYTISPASLEEIPSLLRAIHATEHWNLSLDVPAVWLSLDPGCFLTGRLCGSPIATLLAFRYPDAYGFLSCFWVSPAHRKQGYGLRLFRAGLARLAGCNIGLFAVPAEVPQYERSGFSLGGGCAVIQRGIAMQKDVPGRVIAYDEQLFDRVAAYDREVFPSQRTEFLRQWLAIPSSVVRVCVEDGVVKGFAALSQGINSPVIAPCFADNLQIAIELIQSLINHVTPGQPVGLVLHTANPLAEQLISALHDYAFDGNWSMGCRLMHTQQVPDVVRNKVWAPTSLDTG
jgi:GNAT superfamily N-acetyltransferase